MRDSLPIITIDGPAGVGKTTIARMLAQTLGVPYLDTGSMYRYVALKLGKPGLEWTEGQLGALCAGWHFTLVGIGDESRLECNGEPLGLGLRAEEIGALASKYALKAPVRDALLKAQQKIGANTSLAGDGRDLGTVVFPQARFKFFLDATPQVRAMRRWRQLEEKGVKVDMEKLEREIRQRDHQDRTRPIAPLRPAADARIINTSDMSIPQVMNAMLSFIDMGGGL